MAIFGREPVLSRNSKSYIKLDWVQRNRDAEPLDTEESIKRYVRCQIFCMLGSTLFTDKSTAYAHAKYLPLLRDFERIHTYSWGSACLAHLYRALCRASRYDTKEMDDPLNLLFVWAWERMPCIAPVPRHILPPAEIPVAMRWSHSERSTAWLEKTVVTFRHDIDYMQKAKHSTAGSAPLSDLGLYTDLEVSGLVRALIRTYAEIIGVCSSGPSSTLAPAPQVPPQHAVFEPIPYYVPQPQDQSHASHDWFDFSVGGHDWANASLGGWSDFSAMHSPPVSADPRGASVGMSHGLRRPASDHTSEGASCDSGFLWRTYTVVDEYNPGASAPAEAGGSAPPADAGGSAPPEEAGRSAAAGVDDSVPGHPYDIRTKQNPPDSYTPLRPGQGMMGKALNWMARRK
ncbi:hypothetical protein AHAS_Ahas15G0139200 [Arachis hypogaea]